MHRPRKHGVRGSIDPSLFQVWGGVKEYCLTPTFNVYKTCFLPSLGHYHAPSTPFTAKCAILPKVPHFHIKFAKFSRGNTTSTPLREGTTPSRTHFSTAFGRARDRKHPRSSSPQFDPLLPNTFRGLWLNEWMNEWTSVFSFKRSTRAQLLLRWPRNVAQLEQWKDGGASVLGKLRREGLVRGHES